MNLVVALVQNLNLSASGRILWVNHLVRSWRVNRSFELRDTVRVRPHSFRINISGRGRVGWRVNVSNLTLA